MYTWTHSLSLVLLDFLLAACRSQAMGSHWLRPVSVVMMSVAGFDDLHTGQQIEIGNELLPKVPIILETRDGKRTRKPNYSDKTTCFAHYWHPGGILWVVRWFWAVY